MIWRNQNPEVWHKRFAWFPINAGAYTIWLQTVERRLVRMDTYEGWDWEYRVQALPGSRCAQDSDQIP